MMQRMGFVWGGRVANGASKDASVRILCTWLVLALAISTCRAGINDYKSEEFPGSTYDYSHMGLYTVEDSPSHGPYGNGTSYVQVSLKLQRPLSDNATLSLAFVASSQRGEALGRVIGDRGRRLCCDPSFAKQEGCVAGTLLFNDSFKDYAILTKSSPSINTTFTPKKSEVYYLYLVNCGFYEVAVSGQVIWMNPFGYLPGEDYPLPTFFLILAGFYLATLLVWVGLYGLFRQDLQPLQHIITGVISLGLIGALPSAMQYTHYNNVGYPSYFWVLSAVILNVSKRLISRVLIVLVCSGWTVVRPTLEGRALKYGLPTLSVLYLLVGVAFEIVQSLRNKLNTYMSSGWDLLIIPLTFLDILFYAWIMYELITTMHWLSQRKQAEKLRMYRFFWWMLLTLGSLSVVVSFVQSVFIWQGKRDVWWQTWWFFEAWWQMLYLAILWVIAVIWRPNSNNKRYAYSLQIADSEEAGRQMDEMSVMDTGLVSVRGEDEVGAGGGDEEAEVGERNDYNFEFNTQPQEEETTDQQEEQTKPSEHESEPTSPSPEVQRRVDDEAMDRALLDENEERS